MTYRLILTPRAKQDRDRAFQWYSDHYSKRFADRWYQGVARAIESLRRNPLRCHKAFENDYFSFELYELLYGRRRNKHRILFRVEGDLVVILQIRHSAMRDLTDDDF
jgi:plasmid stabilization system protein ParE